MVIVLAFLNLQSVLFWCQIGLILVLISLLLSSLMFFHVGINSISIKFKGELIAIIHRAWKEKNYLINLNKPLSSFIAVAAFVHLTVIDLMIFVKPYNVFSEITFFSKKYKTLRTCEWGNSFFPSWMLAMCCLRFCFVENAEEHTEL